MGIKVTGMGMVTGMGIANSWCGTSANKEP